MGPRSDSMQSFYSCDGSESDWMPDSGADSWAGLEGEESVSGAYSGMECDIDCRLGGRMQEGASSSGGKVVAGARSVGGYLDSSSLGRYVAYVWKLLPESGVLGMVVRAGKVVTAGVLARAFGSPAADLFVDWGVAGVGAAAAQQDGRNMQE